ncbi:MAG: glycosyltransferase family 1 protein [Bacteroidota bacterium]
MRIAIIADPLDNQRAGVHVYTREFIRALLQDDQDHEYLLIREKVDPDLEVQQIAVPNVRLPIGFASFRLFVWIPLLLRRLKVDAVLEPAHFGPFNLPSHVRRITVIHDLTPILFPQHHRFHSQLLQRIFLKGILRRAHLILANSAHTASDLHQYYPFTEGKVATIHLGRERHYQPTDSRTFLQSQNIKAPYFLFVGTIEPRKNLGVLLQAYAQFRQQSEAKVLLLIVGQKGWKSESLFEQIEVHPYREDIILTGYVDIAYLPELYSQALGFIYPSLYEGFGFPVLEALACGAPVICSRRASLPEVGGEVAYYFEPEAVGELVERMLVVAGLPEAERERLRQCCLEQARRFSWEKYVVGFKEALKRLES